jgi:hypothetical protein
VAFLKWAFQTALCRCWQATLQSVQVQPKAGLHAPHQPKRWLATSYLQPPSAAMKTRVPCHLLGRQQDNTLNNLQSLVYLLVPGFVVFKMLEFPFAQRCYHW